MVKVVKLMNTELTPEGWESKAIGDISNIHRGMSWNADNVTDRPDMGIPVLRIPNVQNKLSLDDLKYLSDISEQYKVRYRVSQGCSIMVGSNGNKDRVGNCCYIEQDMEFVFASFLLACSAKEGNDNKYLFYLLTSYPIQGAISSDAATSTGLHNIGLKFIRKRGVLIPPLPEQRKIAEILSTVDETIEKTDAIIRETQQLKKGLMQKLFTEGIGHTRFKETKVGRIEYGTIPVDWDEVELNSICNVTSSKRIMMHEYVDSGIPFYRSKEIIEKMRGISHDKILYISESRFQEISRRFGVPQNGDILITAVGSLGVPYLIEDDGRFYFKDGNLLWLRDFSREIDKRFLIYYFESFGFKKVIEVITAGSSQKALTIEKLEKLRIPLPNSSEQQMITQILSEVDAKIETEQAFKKELEQLKKGLMQVLLTGKVRVKV